MGGDHHHHRPEAMPREDQDYELLKKHQIPLPYRDNCAHLLVPLNICRRETYFYLDSCQNERHLYEECEYIAWNQRVEAKKKLKEAAAIAEAAAKADS
jgi:NADH dehydrogenase (ubiquinone) 1 beta subcomplex subunit 7